LGHDFLSIPSECTVIGYGFMPYTSGCLLVGFFWCYKAQGMGTGGTHQLDKPRFSAVISLNRTWAPPTSSSIPHPPSWV